MIEKTIQKRVFLVDRIHKNSIATMHNKLIEARYKLTLEEQRIFLALVSLIDKNDEDFKDYKISVQVLKELTGTKRKDIYSAIKEAVSRLLKRTILIETENDFEAFNLISYAKYKKGEGYFIISIDKHLKPYLLKLKEKFTSVSLAYIFRLRSVYSIRLYELLKQYEDTSYRIDEVSTLKEMLGIEKNEYKDWRNFERIVLKKAVQEINEKTDLEVSYKKKKTGRKITHIEFEIHSKKANEIEDTETENSTSESVDIQAQKNNDLWEDTLHLLLTVYDADEEDIEFFKDFAIVKYKTDTKPKQMIIDTKLEDKENRKQFLDVLLKYFHLIKQIVATETNHNYEAKVTSSRL